MAVRVEKKGRFTIAVDGKEYGQGFDQCFDPTFGLMEASSHSRHRGWKATKELSSP